MAVNFYLDRRPDKKGDCAIRLSVCVRGARWITTSGFRIAVEKWDAGKQAVRRGCSNGSGITYSVINAKLSEMVQVYSELENERISSGEGVSVEDLKEVFAAHFGYLRGGKWAECGRMQGVGVSVLGALDACLMECSRKGSWKLGTWNKERVLRSLLEEWRGERLSFGDFDERGLEGFVSFLLGEKGMRNVSVKNQLSSLKRFLRWSWERGYLREEAFRKFAPRLQVVRKRVVFLDWEELMRLWEFEVPAEGTAMELRDEEGRGYEKVVRDAERLRRSKDLFCFSCFTSLRWSDVIGLRWSSVREGALHLTTVKTSDTLKIELNKYALAVLARYEGRREVGGFVFPRLGLEVHNRLIRELCELCGLNAPFAQVYYLGAERREDVRPKWAFMSSHAGRRTFICNALMMGIPANIVMKWTGHSDYQAMRPYIDVADASKAEAMSLWDKR